MRRAGWRPLPAVLALLLAVASALGVPSQAGPVSGAAPASVEVALPAAVGQVALVPRADPRGPVSLAAAPPDADSAPVTAAVPVPVTRTRVFSPVAVPAAGGRSPPAA